MGKKRSQTAKQVQKKVVQKLARALGKQMGVSLVTTKGSGSNRNGAMMGAMEIDSGNNNKKKVAARKQQRHLLRPKKAALVGSNPPMSKQTPAGGGSSRTREKDDFRAAQASLHERHQVMEWKRNTQTAGAGKKATRHSRQPPPASNDAALPFAPPVFCYLESQKTAAQRMDETTARVQSALQGIGSAPPPPPHRTLLRDMGTSSLAARWSSSIAPEEEPAKDSLVTPNPWSALQQEDDDDNDEDVLSLQQQQNALPLDATPALTFAPASFSFGPVAAVGATAEGATSFDPDL